MEGTPIRIQCMGHAEPFDVFLSTSSINYGEIKLGEVVSRMFTINNQSDLPTKFEFFNQVGNLFSLSKTKGVIKAKSNVRIIAYFNPSQTVNYYERVFCIVRNH